MPRREWKYISYASQIFHFAEEADVRCLLATFDPSELKDRSVRIIYINFCQMESMYLECTVKLTRMYVKFLRFCR